MKKAVFSVFAAAVLFGCGSSDKGLTTYEFEDFDGATVVVDEANILCQRAEDQVLDTEIVPVHAEVIAPGRDYVYLADSFYYYVEDAANGLLTVAKKSEDVEYAQVGDSFWFCYSPSSFASTADEDGLTLSYVREGVAAAGSNVVTFAKVDEASCKAFLEEKVNELGGDVAAIIPASLSGVQGESYIYTTRSESEESGLVVVEALYAVPNGAGLVFADVIRTIGPDEGTEMSIDADFEQIFQSFLAL